MKIGFFDSGLGGLTLLEAVRNKLPHYDYMYYGDTANLPYGDKTEEEVYEYTKRAVIYLFEHDVLLVILACNTASAETARKLQIELLTGKYLDRKILGVIVPTVEALHESSSKHALLIGTKRTIESGKYERELQKISSDIKLHSVATPSLVPLIEAGDAAGAFMDLKHVLDTRKGSFDTLVLGCTHYPLLKDFIRSTYDFHVLSQDEIVPVRLTSYLAQHPEIESRLSRTGSLQKVTT